MNQLQEDVLDYFTQNANMFIDWAVQTLEGDVVTIEEFLPLLRSFLDYQIRKELDLYDPKCLRHRELTDLLIEVHVAEQDDYKKAMEKRANMLFRYGRVC